MDGCLRTVRRWEDGNEGGSGQMRGRRCGRGQQRGRASRGARVGGRATVSWKVVGEGAEVWRNGLWRAGDWGTRTVGLPPDDWRGAVAVTTGVAFACWDEQCGSASGDFVSGRD